MEMRRPHTRKNVTDSSLDSLQIDEIGQKRFLAKASVTRHYQLARWQDSSTHLWIGRRKKAGTGEGSSGLRFDVPDD